MLRIVRYIITAWFFFLIAACARLPDYAKPQFRSVVHLKNSLEHPVAYRQLKVEDFRALSPPEDLKAHATKLNAHICSRIQATKDSKFIVNEVTFKGKKSYFASIKKIGFVAVMYPSCSWWNPQIPKEKKAYVLQHEQIHFALNEIAARKLTLEARKVAKSLLVIQTTQKEAHEEISLKIKALIQAAMDESLKEHTAFDEDTSLYFDPKEQRKWLERVKKQLRETSPEMTIAHDT